MEKGSRQWAKELRILGIQRAPGENWQIVSERYRPRLAGCGETSNAPKPTAPKPTPLYYQGHGP